MSVYLRAARAAYRFKKVLWQGRAYFQNVENAAEFRALLIESGPCYIKLGQWLVQRPDLIPQPFLDELKCLQRSAPSHSYEETARVIADEFNGQSIADVFEVFDINCLASGSIAQVHRAVYKGERVAVKVRHPNVLERVHQDLELLSSVVRLGARAGNAFCSIIDIDRIKEEMLAQCDLRHEACCLDEVSINFSENDCVATPRTLFSGEAVLIETFIDNALDYRDIGDPTKDPTYYANDAERDECKLLCKQITLAAFFQMILRDAFVHGDMHSGNLLYRIKRRTVDDIEAQERHAKRVHGAHNNNWRKHVARFDVVLCLLDFGIVVRLNEIQKKAIHSLIVGLFSGHTLTVTDALAQVAMQNNRLEQERFARFAQETHKVLDEVDREKNKTQRIDVPGVLRQLLYLLNRNDVRIDGNVVRVMVDFMLVEEGRPHLMNGNNLTEDCIDWVLYKNGDQFGIATHLMQVQTALFSKRQWDLGNVARPDNAKQSEAVQSISVSQMRKYTQCESLQGALQLQRDARAQEARLAALASSAAGSNNKKKQNVAVDRTNIVSSQSAAAMQPRKRRPVVTTNNSAVAAADFKEISTPVAETAQLATIVEETAQRNQDLHADSVQERVQKTLQNADGNPDDMQQKVSTVEPVPNQLN
jgi:predicted unusual protein kinase regulating ubiquinone biosynthesis (AarF/ABC1/UbiB family)